MTKMVEQSGIYIFNIVAETNEWAGGTYYTGVTISTCIKKSPALGNNLVFPYAMYV